MIRPERDPRLDALKGWLQVTIFVSHMTGSLAALWLIHPAWGLSDSSEQFIFLSGFALGSVFLWKQARQGFAAACRDLGLRMARLWRMHMLVFLGFGLMLVLVAQVFKVECWPHALERPMEALVGGAVLLYQPPPFMGVLPLFLVAMAALPAFSWLLARVGDRALWALFASYALAQVLTPDIPGLGGTTLAFSPPAWVPLFLLGAWAGQRLLRTGAVAPRHPWLIAAAAGVLLLGLWMRLEGIEPQRLTGKEQLAPLRLLHALSCAYLFAVLVPRDIAIARGAVGRMFGTIGRNSLPVFSLGLFLSFLGSLALREAPWAQPWSEPLLLLGGVAILWGLAHRLEARAVRPMAPPAVVAPTR
ncbi:MAG: OpgC domain-containing protein [Rubritepida sp.]|nr:OpgC domain-containing protein [Rubritepida sp.]